MDDDAYNRFNYGILPCSSVDWGWASHMLASLKEGGRAAVVLDTGAVSRGSGSRSANKEKAIRQAFVENDFIEGVVLLRKGKPEDRAGQILLINASNFFVKEKPKNALTEEGIRAVAEAYRSWKTEEKLSRIVTLEEVREADYNLSPSHFVEINERVKHRPIAEILADLTRARAERERADGS